MLAPLSVYSLKHLCGSTGYRRDTRAMYNRAYRVVDGIVYDSDTTDILHHRDTWYGGRTILAVTPDGHFFEAMFAGLITGWHIFPLSRLRAVHWALKNKAANQVLDRLGVTLLPEPNIPRDRPYEYPSMSSILCSRKKLLTNDLLYTVEFLCRNPDGRFFVFDGMILFRRFVFEEYVPMTQGQALTWAIRHGAPCDALEILGYHLDFTPKPA